MARKPAFDSVLPVNEVLKFLYEHGYFGDKAWSDVKKLKGAALQKAVREYQTFNGLAVDGRVDEKTAHRMCRLRCGLPDFNLTAPGGDPCKWPMAKITYFTAITLPNLSEAQVKEAYDVAFSQWAEVCNIEPMRVEKKEHANIYSRSGVGKKHNLDARGGTLAWSELPCGVSENMQLDQMFDEAEDWSFNMAVAVMCHEIGHALGLGHLWAGNLMAPYYDPNCTAPQSGDIEEITKLYGKRKTRYPLTKDAGLKISGQLMINGRPYVLVPQT